MSAFSPSDALSINAIRVLSMDAVQHANSGHPGLPLGAAPMAYVLWHRHLVHDPADPTWYDRDRFVLSAGHGSMLLYSLLHLFGYDLSLDDIRAFRTWDSRTPGHPERGVTPGVEATTGPLGQGSANAVGMALAERFLAERFNTDEHTLVDHFTYALVSDGDLMEGLSGEAASLAGHLGLGKLIYLWDDNLVSLDGSNAMHFTEDVQRRYEAYGWHVEVVADGDTDLEAIDAALTRAKAETGRPSILCVRTTIGYGSPNKAGSSDSHGSPLGIDEVSATRAALGWEHADAFFVPEEAREWMQRSTQRGVDARQAWNRTRDAWANANPELEAERRLAWSGLLPDGWDAELPDFAPDKPIATRSAGGKVLQALAKNIPWLFGGDADLSGSTKTYLAGAEDFRSGGHVGRNIRYGVREHAMGAIANGIAYHGGARTWTATFFTFSDYMRPAMRLAAMNHLPIVHVFTHDSIGLGEDGPTHQPVEHLASLRAMPNTVVIRPADANETKAAWKLALKQRDRPTSLVFSRQDLPVLDAAAAAAGVPEGAYIAAEASRAPEVLLLATGSEVHLALAARVRLESEGVATRVVSMPSWELFEEQDLATQEAVLPRQVAARVAVEAGVSLGWRRWVGDAGELVTLDRFGASAPAEVLFEQLGFTVDAVCAAARTTLERCALSTN
ncbi:MAG: transketolase [Planctomycetota bacterium]